MSSGRGKMMFPVVGCAAPQLFPGARRVGVTIVRLTPAEAVVHLDGLAETLADRVAGGASVNQKLLVHRRARGRGLAGRLMAAAEAEAAALGRSLLCLDTETGGVAEALYAKAGWTRVGVIPDFAKMPDGRPCATTFFYRQLGTAGGRATFDPPD